MEGNLPMRKVSLFIAMSLDGYIADKKGGVDWLNGQDSGTELKMAILHLYKM